MKFKIRAWKGMIFCMIFLISFACKSAAQNTAATARIQAHLKLEGMDQIADSPVFTFRLESAQEDPLPAKTEAVMRQAGVIDFGPVTYNVPGDYHYKLYQIVQNADGKQKAAAKNRGAGLGAPVYGTLTMDTRSYDLTVQVTTDEKGSLAASVCMFSSGTKKKTEPEFLNSYQAPELTLPKNPMTPKGTLPVKTADQTPVVPFLLIMAAALIVMRRAFVRVCAYLQTR